RLPEPAGARLKLRRSLAKETFSVLRCGRRRAGVLLQELHRVTHGLDTLGGIVGNLATELLLEGHHQLDGIQAVSPEIVDEASAVRHLVGLYAQVLDYDLLHALCHVAHLCIPRLTLSVGLSKLLIVSRRPVGMHILSLRERHHPTPAGAYASPRQRISPRVGHANHGLVNTLHQA